MTPLALLILGLGCYALGWIGHDNLRTRIGEWRTPPPWLRRVLRYKNGSVHLVALAFETWAAALVVAVFAGEFGLIPSALKVDLLYAILLSFVGVFAMWIGLATIDYFQRS